MLLALVAVVVAVGGFAAFLTRGTEEPPPDRPFTDVPDALPVAVLVVGTGDLVREVVAEGRLVAARQSEVSAEASGTVQQVLVRPGQRVRAGETLAVLDGRAPRLALADAEAALARAREGRARVARAEGATADTARLGRARRELERARAAYDRGNLLWDDVARARERLDGLERALAGEAGQDATADVGAAERALARARLALEQTRVRAPFAGLVTDVASAPGEYAAPGRALVTLLAADAPLVEADLIEDDLVRVAPGAPVVVTFPALPDETFRGRVVAVLPGERGAGRARIALVQADRRLVPGLFAQVRVEAERLDGRLTIPASAVLRRQDRELVFTVRGGRAQWVYVGTGAWTAERAEVTSGLSPGDSLVVEGHATLAHDSRVRVVRVVEDAP